MELSLATLTIFLLCVVIYHYRDHAIFTRKVKYPSPKCHPVLGNTMVSLKNRDDFNSFMVTTSIELGLPW